MSFTQRDLEAYLVRHKVNELASSYIRRASGGLARTIGVGGFPSVVTEYQSRKMGVTVNTESRTAECLYAIELDFDQNVEAFFEQPPSVDCYRLTKKGHRRLVTYVPDMLVLSSEGPFVVQVKTEKDLQSKVSRSEDWVMKPDGTYRDLPAEKALQEQGLRHDVVSTAQLSKLRAANISLLLQSLEYTSDDALLQARAREFLEEYPVASLEQLAEHLGCKDVSPLLRLVATHAVHTDLARFPLTELDACFVTRDPNLLRDDVYAAWENLRRLPSGRAEASASSEVLPVAKNLARGVAIVDLLDAGASGRSARRWAARLAKGEKIGLSRIVAVTPRYDRSGNRQPKRPQSVLAFAEHVIRSQWGADEMLTPAALWRDYKYRAEKWHPGAKHVSHPTFRKILEGISDSLAEKRGGKRAANAAAHPANVEDRALKASRPFELASCDHYLCDLNCVVLAANNTKYALRPWLTVLRDCYTKSALAFWLALRPPSRRSCALIIRQCLRTHGRLPEGIVVDRGADFRSSYFSALMAHCGIDLVMRPSAHPRFGSEAEGFFGQFQKLWLAARPGNRVNLKEVRSVSKNRQPDKLACLSLLDLWGDLEEFHNWFEHYVTPSSLASPAVLAAEGLKRFACSGRVIPYDETFLIASAVDDGNYRIDRRRGLHIGHHHYWHPSLGCYSRPSVPVRKDPQDPYRVYALVGGTWVTCIASAAPAHDLKHPLRQVVDGVIALDGADLRRVAREDADHALAEALERRNSDRSRPCTQRFASSSPFDASVADNDADLFSEIATQELEPLEIAKW